MIRFLLVEDHQMIRDGIRSLLQTVPDLEIVGEARNGREAFEMLADIPVDVMVVDLNMPVMGGLELTRLVASGYPHIKVLILSMLDHENYVTESLKAGAKGYMIKDSGKDELVYAIKKVASDEKYISTSIAMSAIGKVKKIKYWGQEHTDLSKRELEVLQLIAEGHTNGQIADKLCISRRTIESHRKNLIDKTGAPNTAALIKYAIMHGYI